MIAGLGDLFTGHVRLDGWLAQGADVDEERLVSRLPNSFGDEGMLRPLGVESSYYGDRRQWLGPIGSIGLSQ